jgi:hypothetical protein
LKNALKIPPKAEKRPLISTPKIFISLGASQKIKQQKPIKKYTIMTSEMTSEHEPLRHEWAFLFYDGDNID